MAEKSIDRRSQKTRKALCNALAELLKKKELHKVTVQEISDRAEVNRVTFYKHFLDVYDLYEKIENETIVELGLLLLQVDEQNTEEFFTSIISYISDNRSVFGMVFSPNSTGQLRDKLYTIIEGVFRQTEIEKDPGMSDKELEYMSSYRAQGCVAVISKWVLSDFDEPSEFIVKTIAKLDNNTRRLFEKTK